MPEFSELNGNRRIELSKFTSLTACMLFSAIHAVLVPPASPENVTLGDALMLLFAKRFNATAIIEQRKNEHSSGSFPDVDSSWKEFQIIYNTLESTDRSLYPNEEDENYDVLAAYSTHKPQRKMRSIIPVAAIIALLVGALTIPVAGYGSLLEMIGSWTANQFTFLTTGSEKDPGFDEVNTAGTIISEDQTCADLRKAVQEHGITPPVVPGRLPDGFELIGDISVQEYPNFGKVDFYASYSNGSDSCTFKSTIIVLYRPFPLQILYESKEKRSWLPTKTNLCLLDSSSHSIIIVPFFKGYTSTGFFHRSRSALLNSCASSDNTE